jgi:hypothetical protein
MTPHLYNVYEPSVPKILRYLIKLCFNDLKFLIVVKSVLKRKWSILGVRSSNHTQYRLAMVYHTSKGQYKLKIQEQCLKYMSVCVCAYIYIWNFIELRGDDTFHVIFKINCALPTWTSIMIQAHTNIYIYRNPNQVTFLIAHKGDDL